MGISTNSTCLFLVVIGAMSLAGLPSNTAAQMIVAHRGASNDAPENTLAAFELAWQQNADGIEGDFYLTADSEIVCIHDDSTKRTAKVELNVESSTLAELRSLEVGRWKSPKFDGEKIPTFAEVLATVPQGRTFVIELKSDHKIVEPLVAALARLDHANIKLLVISFDEQTVTDCKKRLPNVEAHWLTSFKRKAPGLPYHPSADEIAAVVRRCGADGVGMKSMPKLIDQAFVSRLHAGGCPAFHVWTVDLPTDAKHFQSLGAMGITTNVPKEIRAAID
ncbi:putative glycerophosphoryl diester phosphodiesterase 1 [Planctomycetes bacterium CA13]|uniref:Putative glycerophosphoryl diester phosphodiesterase 1 n=1 Tax=Novipirellula herctigrandis TaxID=2527986 RepID=A0A5C5Z9Z3_9BACT|nr:putative glycerophosphoryl diester phosphodiesterase 1 [Planctomycetes bacterium CA13]